MDYTSRTSLDYQDLSPEVIERLLSHEVTAAADKLYGQYLCESAESIRQMHDAQRITDKDLKVRITPSWLIDVLLQ